MQETDVSGNFQVGEVQENQVHLSLGNQYYLLVNWPSNGLDPW